MLGFIFKHFTLNILHCLQSADYVCGSLILYWVFTDIGLQGNLHINSTALF